MDYRTVNGFRRDQRGKLYFMEVLLAEEALQVCEGRKQDAATWLGVGTKTLLNWVRLRPELAKWYVSSRLKK